MMSDLNGPLLRSNLIGGSCSGADGGRAIEMANPATGEVVQGGKRHGNGGPFLQPTVIQSAMSEMHFATDEIFGPLSAAFRIENEEEVIAAANATEFGLAPYADTQDLGRVFRLDEGLDYGMIGINSDLITTGEAPFGAVRESGMGKQSSSQGPDDCLETRYICMDGIGI